MKKMFTFIIFVILTTTSAIAFANLAAYKAIKALGGVKATVQLLAKASNTSDWLAIGGGAAAEILGIDGVKTYIAFNKRAV